MKTTSAAIVKEQIVSRMYRVLYRDFGGEVFDVAKAQDFIDTAEAAMAKVLNESDCLEVAMTVAQIWNDGSVESRVFAFAVCELYKESI